MAPAGGIGDSVILDCFVLRVSHFGFPWCAGHTLRVAKHGGEIAALRSQ